MEERKYLDMKEVGSYLGIGRDKTRMLFNKSDFPSIKIGKRFIVFEDDLYEYLKSKRYTTIITN